MAPHPTAISGVWITEMQVGGWRVECHRTGCPYWVDTYTRDYARVYAEAHARACTHPDLTTERYGDMGLLEMERFGRW